MGRPTSNVAGKVNKAAKEKVNRPFAASASFKDKAIEATRKTKEQKRKEKSQALTEKLERHNPEKTDPAVGKLNLKDMSKSLEGVGGDKDTLFAILAADKVKSKLGSSSATQRPKQKKAITRKQVGSIMKSESQQFQAVAAHPAVQNDVFGTLQTHLANTIMAQKQAQNQLMQVKKIEQKVLAKEKQAPQAQQKKKSYRK